MIITMTDKELTLLLNQFISFHENNPYKFLEHFNIFEKVANQLRNSKNFEFLQYYMEDLINKRSIEKIKVINFISSYFITFKVFIDHLKISNTLKKSIFSLRIKSDELDFFKKLNIGVSQCEETHI